MVLTTLVILFSVKGDVEQQIRVQKAKVLPHTGSFVQPPLNVMQINALRHLATHLTDKRRAELYVSHMTLDEEIGQLITVQYSGAGYSPDLEVMINQLHAGGVILYRWQMATAQQTKNDIIRMQQHATIPLLISTDEEGGYVDRIGNIYPYRPSASEIFYSGNVNLATYQGHKTAHDLQALGINTDMAPDVDVQVVAGPDELTRTFGTTPDSVIKFAGAYMRAIQSDGMIACIKHFPGLGAATIDAHQGLPIITRTQDQIYSVELAPYKAFIQSQNEQDHPGMVMSTDLLMPAIDPTWPAELSHTFITDILRNQLGYDGVVTTDALYMAGIANKWSLTQAAVLALQAGDDMLLGPIGSYQMQATIDAIKAALMNDTLSKARIDEAATRIITLKMMYHLISTASPLG